MTDRNPSPPQTPAPTTQLDTWMLRGMDQRAWGQRAGLFITTKQVWHIPSSASSSCLLQRWRAAQQAEAPKQEPTSQLTQPQTPTTAGRVSSSFFSSSCCCWVVVVVTALTAWS